MYKNKLMPLYRNIRQHRKALISLVSVLLTLTFIALVYLYWNSKFNIVEFSEKDCPFFQVMMNGPSVNEGTPTFLAEDLAGEMPEVVFAVTIEPSVTNNAIWNKGFLICPEQYKTILVSSHFVSKDFFKVLDYDLTVKPMLLDEETIYMSKEIALELFGNWRAALGKTVEWKNERYGGAYTVIGIFSIPSFNCASEFQFDILFSFESFLKDNDCYLKWNKYTASTFVHLKRGTNIDQFNTKIRDFLKSKDQNLHNTLFVKSN